MVQTITDGETITLVIDLSSEDRKKLCGCELVNNGYYPRSLGMLPGSGSKKVVLEVPRSCYIDENHKRGKSISFLPSFLQRYQHRPLSWIALLLLLKQFSGQEQSFGNCLSVPDELIDSAAAEAPLRIRRHTRFIQMRGLLRYVSATLKLPNFFSFNFHKLKQDFQSRQPLINGRKNQVFQWLEAVWKYEEGLAACLGGILKNSPHKIRPDSGR